VLKPGQTLRLGQVELKLETGADAGTGHSATGTPLGGTPSKPRQVDATLVIPRGVSLDQLEQGGQNKGLASATAFSKKKDKANKIFIIIGIVVAVIVVGLLIMVFNLASEGTHH